MIHSLRARLLLWLLLPMAAFVLISGYASYLRAVDTANRVQDRALQASAEVIAGQVDWFDGRLLVHVPPAALSLFDSPFGDHVFYNVVDDTGQVLAGNPGLGPPMAGAANPVFYPSAFQGLPVRVIQLSRLMFNDGHAHKVTVTVGQTLKGNRELVQTLSIPALAREVALLLLAVMLMVCGLTVELRPLLRVRDEVAGRDPMDLDPVKAGDLPQELRPIVEVINQCIQRLNEYVLRQKRFIADAAHQIRTPLAILGVQLRYATQLRDDSKLREIIGSAEGSTQAMTDLVNKLLLLSQAEAWNASAPGTGHVVTDLVPAVTAVLEDLVVLAQRKQIDLGADMPAGCIRVRINEWMLVAVISNLVDNAIRYTPDGGQVTVTVRATQGHATLSVSDNGRGIPPEARPKVFDRFYRNAEPHQQGSGLGLAIVKEIVVAAQGTIGLAPGIGGKGLTLTVTLPLAG
ncbi:MULTISPECIES: sensor histidine kinase [Cupriavidus]|jgi:two-component system, OmpR family, sensor histidine kinase TctE|uniref:histidine kinase n=1 Tax=Cupriavidus metallidurans TaxID=119219 RepID=A0A482J1L9_9BURK|nr:MULTISPECIES: sensor histidine kinase [Cupriavidus]KWR81690.1 histidine kinase [Cupriavidus sp. SHE]QBP13014.1 sensor histidine kinase [Cupriavidus metallidurans]QWC90803.1 sensor histidine kinase [Cupriavidus metallidurans]